MQFLNIFYIVKIYGLLYFINHVSLWYGMIWYGNNLFDITEKHNTLL